MFTLTQNAYAFFGLTVFCVCLLMLRNHKYGNKNVFHIEKAV